MKETEGTVSLVDASALVPGLKFKKGLHTWKLANKACTEFYSKVEDVPENMVSTMRDYMFPPTAEEAKEMHLERCMRVLPHMQDTGGFFVAVMEKTALCPWESKKKNEKEGEEKKVKEGEAEGEGELQ